MKLTFVNYCWNEIVLTPSLSTSLPVNQPTVSKHWRNINRNATYNWFVILIYWHCFSVVSITLRLAVKMSDWKLMSSEIRYCRSWTDRWAPAWTWVTAHFCWWLHRFCFMRMWVFTFLNDVVLARPVHRLAWPGLESKFSQTGWTGLKKSVTAGSG